MATEAKINTAEIKIGKCLINTFIDKVGNPLHPMGHLTKKVSEGHALTKEEIATMHDAYNRIKKVLDNFKKMAQTDFVGVVFTSDKSGLISHIELPS